MDLDQEMPPNVRKWIDSLRSGECKQGSERLRTSSDKFCCLGVATDLAVKDGVGEWVTKPGGWAYVADPTSGVSMGTYLPDAVVQWLRLSPRKMSHVAECKVAPNVTSSLVGLNDDGVPFNDIADVIEKVWPQWV